MEIIVAVGMLAGLAGLAIALWTFPKLRNAFFGDYTGLMLAATLLLGGWLGYLTFAALFMSK